METRIRLKSYLRVVVLFGLFLQACGTDNPDDNQIIPEQESGEVADEFRPFVDRFTNEMNQRGLNLSTTNLTVTFVDKITMPNSDRFCAYGYVNFQGSGSPRVEVINTERCWGRWSETEKENLMFHELGHALLGYGHISGTLPNGSQKSLMCASETCNNYRVYNSYQNEQRTYYLDELVNSKNIVPDWASQKTFSRTIAEDSFDNGIEEWTTEIGQDPNSEIPYEFYLDENQTFSPPKALGIRAISSSSTSAFGHWKKTFDISDFENCSNVVIRADIFSKNLVDGSMGIAIDLLKRNTSNELEFFARYSNALRDLGAGNFNSENFESQVICLPMETAAIHVLLYLNASKDAMVTFDNLEIELYE